MIQVHHNEQRSLRSGIAVLASGAAVAQLLSLVSAPLLSRLYNPADFGVLALFTVLLSLLVVVAGWRYETAIAIPRSARRAAGLAGTAIAATLLTAGTALATITLWGKRLAEVLSAPNIQPLLWLIPVALVCAGVHQTLTYWSVRSQQFARVAAGRALRTVITVALQLAGGLWRATPSALVGGVVLGHAVGAIFMLLATVRHSRHTLASALSLRRVLHTGAQFARYPLFSAPQGLVSAFSQLMPSVLLSVHFGSVAVGLYWFAYRLLTIPNELIGQGVREVFLQRAAAARANGSPLSPAAIRLTARLAAVGIVPLVLVILLAPELFKVVFGPDWERAGDYARWLALWQFLLFLNPPTLALLNVLGLQRQHLAYELCLLAARASALSAAVIHRDPLIAVASFALVSALAEAVMVIGGLAAANRHDRSATRGGSSSTVPPAVPYAIRRETLTASTPPLT